MALIRVASTLRLMPIVWIPIRRISFQVDYRTLSAPITHIRMIGAVYHVQHDRSGAEVKGDIVADMVARMAVHRQAEAGLFDS